MHEVFQSQVNVNKSQGLLIGQIKKVPKPLSTLPHQFCVIAIEHSCNL